MRAQGLWIKGLARPHIISRFGTENLVNMVHLCSNLNEIYMNILIDFCKNNSCFNEATIVLYSYISQTITLIINKSEMRSELKYDLDIQW